MKTTNRKERRERKETFARFASFAVKKNKKNGKFFGLPDTYINREIQETKLGFPAKKPVKRPKIELLFEEQSVLKKIAAASLFTFGKG